MIKLISATLLTFITSGALAQKIEKPSSSSATTFAIVTDDITRAKAGNAINAYKQSIEKDGLGTYIISHNWKSPDEIKAILKKLYQQSPKLEGAVFIGDIPIPMIRDAQYLTSAFKMNQRINWQRSSVPSDRFYDDFDLDFRFLKQDSARQEYFYYSVQPATQQGLTIDIYTARIKPPAMPGKDKYQQIEQYLNKAVAEKAKQNALNSLLVYTGQGYNSESLNSWAGEQIALREQFSGLFKPGNSVKFMNFRMNTAIKYNLLSELRRPDLDMAVLHHHGADDQQLMNGYPYVSYPQPSIDNIRRYLRNKVQSAAESKKRDVEEVKAGFVKSLGVPEQWMEDALTDSMMEMDSLFNDSQNINISDLAGRDFNARFIMLDACLNGSFQLDDYIAGYYPFSSGNNVVTIASSVGVLQDLWPDEMLGLMQFGVRTGNWFKHIANLETHIMGDPTFHFAGKASVDLNKGIVLETKNAAYWQGLLKNASPDIQCLALAHLFNIKGSEVSGLLKTTYFNSPYGATRMEALKLLTRLNNNDCREVLKAAIYDPYEFIRRQTAYIITDMGDDSLIPSMVQLAITDRHSKRVFGKARDGLTFMDIDKVVAEIKKQIASDTYLVDGKQLGDQLIQPAEYARSKVARNMDVLMDTSKPIRERLMEVTTLRTYNYHWALPQVATLILDNTQDKQLRLAGLDAFSWFIHSYQRPLIIATCNKILADTNSDSDMKEQALRTKNRMMAKL